MQATQVASLERTIQKTNEWLKDVQERMGAPDRRHAYLALRATLHALRDRLPPEEALHLASQMPTLVRGIFFEGWRLADKPLPIRAQDEFLGVIVADSQDVTLDAEQAARSVFAVLAERITQGEIEDVTHALPPPLRELWPQSAR